MLTTCLPESLTMAAGSRKDAERTRRERAEEARRATQKGERTRGLLIWGGVGLVLVLIAGAVVWGLRSQDAAQAEFSGRVQEYDEASNVHVTSPVEYDVSPPVGGKHNPTWLNCGTYDAPVPTENAVHSLEHGAVWITYRDDLPATQVRRIAEAADGQPYVLVSPFPGLPAPVVASAWGVQLPLTSAADPRLGQFIQRYAQGRQTPEPGAPCSGALDRPTLP